MLDRIEDSAGFVPVYVALDTFVDNFQRERLPVKPWDTVMATDVRSLLVDDGKSRYFKEPQKVIGEFHGLSRTDWFDVPLDVAEPQDVEIYRRTMGIGFSLLGTRILKAMAGWNGLARQACRWSTVSRNCLERRSDEWTMA